MCYDNEEYCKIDMRNLRNFDILLSKVENL